MSAKILIVDDSTTDCMIINNMLNNYVTLTAYDGLEAMEIIEDNPEIDLIILDLNMPRMDGFQVLKKIKDDCKYKNIRTIILTNFDEIDNEIKGLKLGAVDYVRKPVNIDSLKLRIDIHLKLKEMQEKVEEDNKRLDSLVIKKSREFKVTRDISIQAFVRLLEVRNIESHNHTIRTKKFMKLLCEHLKTQKKYKDILTDDYINELVTTTVLHDIGKVGIPDSILLKPDRLTEDEYNLMKKHVDYGVKALKDEVHCETVIPSFINTAIEIIATHHEKYDGTGYPAGLAGELIPLSGRLMAIIDVFDALMSKRVYKPAYEYSFVIKYIKNESGKHFDPDIVKYFLEIQDKILEIFHKYAYDTIKEGDNYA